MVKMTVEHPETGIRKTAYVGFELGILFFGPLYPLFRGDFKWFFIMCAVDLFTLGLGFLIFPFIYNKIYLKELLKKGYRVSEIQGSNLEEMSKRLGISLKRMKDESHCSSGA